MTKDFTNRPFDKLKKQIDRRSTRPPSPAPSVVQKSTTDDQLFQDAMLDVREIGEFRVLPCTKGSKRPGSPCSGSDPDSDALAILDQIARGGTPINLSHTQEYVEWTNPDAEAEILSRMHAGHFSIQGYLDLHGYWGEEVNEEVDAFIGEAFTRGWRCVKIIHGRGLRSVNGPVLKDAVIRRLMGRWKKHIVGFVSARQCDGGLGAMYVMLRR